MPLLYARPDQVPTSTWSFSVQARTLPVSYTHLAQNLKDNNGDATGATVTWSSKNTWRGGDTPSTGAVSYTHLDVYKRQG